jgi:glycosyltransferase involved in cell wall biosynthesis
MKVLQLCLRVPYPPDNGGSIAMLALTRSLKEAGNDVFVLSINTPKHHYDINSIPTDIKALAQWDIVNVNTEIRPLDAFFNLFTNKSYNIERFQSKDFEKKLTALLQKESFDVIQMESLYVTPYINCIRKHSKAKIVYRAHNLEYKIWERMTEGLPNGLKKSYIRLLTRRLKHYECNIVNSFDAIVAITKEDKQLFKEIGCTIPIHVTPIGVDVEVFNLPVHRNKYPVLFHLGSMNWMPNMEAVDWFLSNVWKDLHNKFLALKFYIGGRGMPERLLKSTMQGIYVFDEVADAKTWINSKDIMICPLKSGGGMRVKIIEAMALGKTVISTSIGAEGIQYTHMKDILIANTPEEFIEMVSLLINNRELCDNIGINAKALIQQHYNNKVIGSELNSFYQTLIR